MNQIISYLKTEREKLYSKKYKTAKYNYRLLISYTRSWFFKIDDKDVFVSDEIHSRYFLRSVYYRINYHEKDSKKNKYI